MARVEHVLGQGWQVFGGGGGVGGTTGRMKLETSDLRWRCKRFTLIDCDDRLMLTVSA
jgi:hypothetical protein